MFNRLDEFSRFVNSSVDGAVRRAMRSNSGQFDGAWEYHKITPGTAYTVPNNFVWVSTVKYGSQANVAYAQRANCNVDIKIDTTHATKSSNALTANDLDSEFFQDAEHPFYWPIPRYLAGGQRVLFTGGTAYTGAYFVMHGFRPIKDRVMQSARIPYVYVMGWNNIAQSTVNIDTCEILTDTKFVVTHVIALQRNINATGNYTIETTNMSLDVNIVNKPVGPNTINTAMMFGSPSFPFKLDAPITIDGGNSIYVTGTAPAWGANNRDVFLYFVGVQILA